MICRVSNNCLKVLELSWCWYGLRCVELVTIVLNFCTCLDLDMDIVVDYNM